MRQPVSPITTILRGTLGREFSFTPPSVALASPGTAASQYLIGKSGSEPSVRKLVGQFASFTMSGGQAASRATIARANSWPVAPAVSGRS